MSYPAGRPSQQKPADDWKPPQWDKSIEARARRGTLLGPQLPDERDRQKSSWETVKQKALPSSAVYLLTALIAFLLWTVMRSVTLFGAPLGLAILLLLAVLGYLFSRSRETKLQTEEWLGVLVAVAIILPLTVIQVSLLREPFVSVERHSSGPALVASIVSLLAISAAAVGCAVLAHETPENAALLFLPVAMMVVAALGAPLDLSSGWVLGMIAVVYLLAGTAKFVGEFVRPGIRMLLPPIFFAIEILLLIILGRGPVAASHSGGIVRIVYLLTLALVIAMLVAVPVISAWQRHNVMARSAANDSVTTTYRPASR